MTTNLRRQPKGITTGGQFAEAIHPEPDLRLASEAPERHGLETDELIDLACSHTGEGLRPLLVMEADAVQTEEGRELHRQILDAKHNPQSRYMIDRAYSYDLKPGVCDELGELGYTSINQLTGGSGRIVTSTSVILSRGVSPERLAVISRRGDRASVPSEWECDAIYGAPVEDLAAVIDTEHESPFDRYRALAVLTDPERGQRIDDARKLGITHKDLIEATDHPLETFIGIRDNLSPTNKTAWTIRRLADRGITGDHLKTYGSRVCEKFDGPDLDAAGIKPTLLRSLSSGDGMATLEQLKKYAEGGFTKGTDLRATRTAMGDANADTLIKAHKHATGEQLGAYRAKLKHNLSLGEAKAVGSLVRSGYANPDDLIAHTRAIHTPANVNVDRSQSVLDVYAGIAKAGISAERLGELTRAGIPVDQAVAYRNSTNEWADGQQFRDAAMATQARRVKEGWSREAPGWEHTEENFRTPPQD